MSKIYEALLRAEQDRVALSETTDSPALLFEPLPLEARNTQPRSTEPQRSASRFASDLSPAPTAIRKSDPVAVLTKVRTYTWDPSFKQLPSLEPRGSSVEQFRSLRSRMQEFRENHTLKSILISSGHPQEGKSFVAANLAISFARHKASRVLLIDGDMRRPSLHKLLGAPCDPGLSEFLSGKADMQEVMQRGRVPGSGNQVTSGLASLTFIAGGMGGDKAADLSGNHRFDDLITAARDHFDWIIVDSSPVNLVSDGVNLARACDGVLLVARGGVTKFEAAQRALNELKASNVLGFVLNAVEDSPERSGYYGYDSPTEE
ncbi:tyrosine-protein kinase family protein [Granulicella sibirica]|uniref:Protein-tyrosine kinase n=1 Tax=Granulicella sibirica TaxID=2479048 RepID=A0A4Q0SV08_9BACT|nr:CpsD/CapB family tyrosine-protein kinase [Granulicella sibirica]RXH54587.1 Protein-tyrosine kinase [Granulicella sibirica]